MGSLWGNPRVEGLITWLAVGMPCYPEYNRADEKEPFGEDMKYGVWRSIADFVNAAGSWYQWPAQGTYTARTICRPFKTLTAPDDGTAGRLSHILHRSHDLPSLPPGLVPEPVLQKLPEYGRGKFSIADVDNATNAWKRLIDAQIPGRISAGTAVLPGGVNASDAVDPGEADTGGAVVH